jgi:hypothetical protein
LGAQFTLTDFPAISMFSATGSKDKNFQSGWYLKKIKKELASYETYCFILFQKKLF